MADVITRFKLETTQYDSALRDASQGLAKLTEQLALAGNEFGKFSQKDVEAAKSLGQVESGATNLKDKLRDLVSAYNNVAKAYNNLTNEQKQNDYGKAMASSLEQLQQRITATKNELYGLNSSTKQTGDGLGALNNIFGTSITKLAGWGAAIAGIKGALNVAKDAFFASEQNIDEWGRAVEAAETIYEGFLTSINTGDIRGFLGKIDQITTAAYEAYNALDLLGTQKAIQSPQVSAKQAEIARMRTILQTGRYIAPADGRTPTDGLKTGDQLTKEQLNRVSKQLESAMGEIAKITASQVSSATDAIDKLYNEQAAVLGVSKKRFLDATSSWEKFQVALDKGAKYQTEELQKQAIRAKANAGISITSEESAILNRKNPYQDWAWVSHFKDDGERFKRIVDEIQKRDAASSQLYSQYGQVYRRINKAEGFNPYGGTTTTTTEAKTVAAKLTDEQKAALAAAKEAELATQRLTEAQNRVADALNANDYRAYSAALADMQKLQPNMGGVNLKTAFTYTNSNMSTFIAQLNDQLAHAELGSTLYKNLTAQLADAQMLANLMQVAIKNGIDIAQFDPQALFNKIFGENPGDYIQPEKWEEVRKQIEAIVGKPITIDVNTGQVNVNGKNEGVKTTGQKDSMSQLINNVHTMTRCLQDMGIEVPEGFQKVISSMNLVTTILQTIQSLSATSGAFGKGGGILGLVGGLFSSIFGGFFANGGIVPHAANGMIVPGNDHADRTLIAASSGELIMSLAQQNNLAAGIGQMMTAGQMQRTEATIESDQIRLVLANGAQAKGMTIGEYLGIG